MIPDTIRLQVLELVERLRSGALDGRGPVDLGDGMPLDAINAARVIIAESRHLAERLEAEEPVSPWRWRLIEEQLERLWVDIA